MWRAAGLDRETAPKLTGIYTCPAAGEPMQRHHRIEALAGKGLAGDRYARGKGYWHPVESCQLTLISEGDLARAGKRVPVSLALGEHRRNLVIGGGSSLALLGRRFRLGEAVLRGLKPRPPCGYIDGVSESGMAKALGRDSGICVVVEQGGLIEVGDSLVFL